MKALLFIGLLCYLSPSIALTPIHYQHAFDIEGHPVSVNFSALFRQHQNNQVLATVSADFADLQAKLPGIVSGRKKYDECGDRLELWVNSLEPAGGNLRVLGKVTGERWECVKFDVPVMRGIKIYSETKTVKTKLISQSADFDLVLSPVIVNNEIDVRLEESRVNFSGVLGELIKAFGVQEFVNQEITRHLRNAMRDEVRPMALPKELQELDFTLQSIAFTSTANGSLGAVAEGIITISWVKIMQLLSK